MTSNIGLNIEFAAIAQPDLCLERLSQLKPAWCLTFSVNDANAIRKSSPETQVIIRHYPDGGVNPKLSADAWMKKYEGVANAGYHVEATNEDGLQISWLTDPQKGILPAALKRGWKICAPALQTGVPEPDEWKTARPFFDLLAQYPNQLRFSFHEYFSAVPTSGMGGKVLDTETAKSWNPDTPLPNKGLRYYHCGRVVDFGFAYLDANGLPRPPMVITELGMATMTDHKKWLQTLKRTPPYQDTSNGWLTMSGQFQEWWPSQPGVGHISPARRYAQMIAWLDKNLYAPNNIPCIVYCYGADPNRQPGSEQDWLPFSVENDDFFDELLKYVNSTATPQPVSPPTPVNIHSRTTIAQSTGEFEPAVLHAAAGTEYWIPVTVAPSGPFANVRAAPSVRGAQLWQLLHPMTGELDLFNVLPDTDNNNPSLRWFKFRTLSSPAAYIRSDVVTFLAGQPAAPSPQPSAGQTPGIAPVGVRTPPEAPGT